ncbi:hypothetical protein FPOAC1_004236 [Fusarium poae]|uniref:hypothetical protein n=1 Tax=Fusarium poae TaxID=36050 RepID=UPI001CE7A276|nr:hypothetical protein FPOAC1_004236 [Fusarium poae]KAG8671000.1 hypothetical protein FPOAC1_004236 [Fusarium poae]
MNTNDLAHLEAMGLPAPAYVAPSLRQDIRNRSDEMQIHQLANLVTPLVYATRRSHVPEEELASFEACRSNNSLSAAIMKAADLVHDHPESDHHPY